MFWSTMLIKILHCGLPLLSSVREFVWFPCVCMCVCSGHRHLSSHFIRAVWVTERRCTLTLSTLCCQGSHGACQILVKIEQHRGAVRYCVNIQSWLCVNPLNVTGCTVASCRADITERINWSCQVQSSVYTHVCMLVFACRHSPDFSCSSIVWCWAGRVQQAHESLMPAGSYQLETYRICAMKPKQG